MKAYEPDYVLFYVSASRYHLNPIRITSKSKSEVHAAFVEHSTYARCGSRGIRYCPINGRI